MHELFRFKSHEHEHGPHFDETCANKAVSGMVNEDGTTGPHWSLTETTSVANQYGVKLTEKFNKYDWFVALNMIYSDYYAVIVKVTGSSNIKHFVEFTKAWLDDKDIAEGKMWYYYMYVMCDKVRKEEDWLYDNKGTYEHDNSKQNNHETNTEDHTEYEKKTTHHCVRYILI